jgi:hypothetical protein
MDSISNPSDFQWVGIALVTIFGGARWGRLLAFDHWPPVVWLRDLWDEHTSNPGWRILMHCAFCIPFWTTFAVLLTGYFTDWHTIWWLVNGGAGAAYVASYVLVYDGSDD